jgi:hypothetical protein
MVLQVEPESLKPAHGVPQVVDPNSSPKHPSELEEVVRGWTRDCVIVWGRHILSR